MNTSEPMIQDYDAVLDARYGKEGTPERLKFEEDAYAYYTGLILRLAEVFCLRSVSISADSRFDYFHRHSQSGNHPIENSNAGYYHSVFDTRYI